MTVLVYLPSLQNAFVDWDDNMYVFENTHIQSINTAFFKWAFTNFDASNWHPLTWISHALDYAVWGLNPLGHHLTNVILHGFNTFIVILLIMKLLEVSKKGDASIGPITLLNERTIFLTGGVAGLLFGLHPLHVESVAWVAERKDLLCALFFMASIIVYVDHSSLADKEPRQTVSSSILLNKHYLLALSMFILALMSKPMAVSLPVVLLMLDWHPLKRIHSFRTLQTAFVEKIPFIALSLVSSALTIIAQKRTLVPTQNILMSERVLVACKALIVYLWKMIVPIDLIPYYQYPYPQEISILSFEYALPVVLVIGITAAVVVMAKYHKNRAVFWGYYIVTLLPVLGIVQVGQQAMADRYTYLPSLAPFFAAGLFTAWLSEKVNMLTRGRQAVKLASLATIMIVFVSLSFLTVRQTRIWKNGIDLWRHTLEIKPDTYSAYNNLGLAYFRQGRTDQALRELQNAVSLEPSRAEAHNNLGVVYFKLGRFDEAVNEYEYACYLHPGYTEAHFNLGLAYFKQGRVDEAVNEYQTALSLDPDDAKVLFNLGNAYADQGRFDEAVRAYTAALRLEPYYADAHYNLGTIHSRQGRLDEAAAEFQIALEITPDYADIHNNLGIVYAEQGRYDEAVREYSIALRLKPDYAKARNNLGNAHAKWGRFDDAIGEYANALELDPGYADAHYNLGSVYENQGRIGAAIKEYKAAFSLNPDFTEARERLRALSEQK